MTDYRDGAIHGWNGGECPVHPQDVVALWFREGGADEGTSELYSWHHDPGDGDIIAFCVTKKYEEPLTIWVNFWSDGNWAAFQTEEQARNYGDHRHARIAVKFQEVKE